MNINFCQTNNMRSENGIVVKLIDDWEKVLNNHGQVDSFILDMKGFRYAAWTL